MSYNSTNTILFPSNFVNILLKVQKDVAGSLKAFREPRSLKQYREHTAYPSFTVFSLYMLCALGIVLSFLAREKLLSF